MGIADGTSAEQANFGARIGIGFAVPFVTPNALATDVVWDVAPTAGAANNPSTGIVGGIDICSSTPLSAGSTSCASSGNTNYVASRIGIGTNGTTIFDSAFGGSGTAGFLDLWNHGKGVLAGKAATPWDFNSPVNRLAATSDGTCTTAKTIDPVNGNDQALTLTNGDTCALTFTQPSFGVSNITLKVIQSSTTAFNGAISGCKWPGGIVPTITVGSGAIDIVSVYLDGTNAYCTIAQNFS